MASQANLTSEQNLFTRIKDSPCTDGDNTALINYNNNKNDNRYLTQLAMYLRQRQQYCTDRMIKQNITQLIKLLQERILFDYKYPPAVTDGSSPMGQNPLQYQQQEQKQEDSEEQTRFRNEVDQRFTNVEQALNILVNMNAEELINQDEIGNGVMQAIASIEGVQQGVDAMHGDLKKGFEKIQDKIARCLPPSTEVMKIVYCFLSLISLIIVVLVLVHKIYYQVAMTSSRIMRALGGSAPMIGGFLGGTMQSMTLIIFALAYVNFITFITGGLVEGTVIAGNILYYIRVFIETIIDFAVYNLNGLKSTLYDILGIAFPEYDGLTEILNGLKDSIISLFEPYLNGVANEVATAAGDAAREAATEAVASTFSAPVDAVSSAAAGAVEATSNALSGAADAVSDALGNAGEYFRNGGGGHALSEQKTKGTSMTKVGGGGKDLAECLIVAVDTFGKIGDFLTKVAIALEQQSTKEAFKNLSHKKKSELQNQLFYINPQKKNCKYTKSVGSGQLAPIIKMCDPFIKQGIILSSSLLKPPQRYKVNVYLAKVATGSPYFIDTYFATQKQQGSLKKKKSETTGTSVENPQDSLMELAQKKITTLRNKILQTTSTPPVQTAQPAQAAGKRRKKTRKEKKRKKRKKRKSNKKHKNKKRRTKRKNKRRRTKRRKRR
tara:strand:+ start:104 stop:2098 length:1995 start_codon:yes stop_codon:yes gene_type:complete